MRSSRLLRKAERSRRQSRVGVHLIEKFESFGDISDVDAQPQVFSALVESVPRGPPLHSKSRELIEGLTQPNMTLTPKLFSGGDNVVIETHGRSHGDSIASLVRPGKHH